MFSHKADPSSVLGKRIIHTKQKVGTALCHYILSNVGLETSLVTWALSYPYSNPNITPKLNYNQGIYKIN